MGGLSTWLDPFGMLDSQVVMNLLQEQEFGVGADLVRQSHRLGERFKRGGTVCLTCLVGECALF